MATDLSSFQALEARTELKSFGDKRLLLFSLELGFGMDDIVTVAASSLTDGPDDKKVDLLHVDRDVGRAVIAQGYISGDPSRAAAPANKASELNTAATWVLRRDTTGLPEYLRSAVRELHDALDDGSITSLELWFCHNLPASKNVQTELARARDTARDLLDSHFPSPQGERSVSAVEVDRGTIQSWYESKQVPILITDTYELPASGGFEASGDKWQAFTTSVQASWLHNLFDKYGRRLFSANVRDYLGSRNSDRNINNNIKKTASEAPQRF